ncbi:MAG TPA: GspH/FimT family pseudopilin [Gammaproteobacteria bacterium]|nr:GspH/FimT family pseudopilin [Gammaproteobacteria bacterium]
MNRNHGFTMIELIAVVIIVGILAAFTLPHFLGRAAFDARGVHDSLASALRYAHKVAIASNCPVQVQIQTGSYSLQQRPQPCGSGAFSEPVLDPTRNSPFADSNLHGVTLSPATTITFTATGATASGANTTISVTGAGRTRTLTVIGGTGYVRD